MQTGDTVIFKSTRPTYLHWTDVVTILLRPLTEDEADLFDVLETKNGKKD